MLIWNDVDAVPMDWPASVVTIGVFDGFIEAIGN